MLDVDKLRASLIRHEGCILMPYVDTTGNITIGVGHNLSAHGITHAQAMAWLDEDIGAAVTACHEQLPWSETLDDVRQRVLIELCFNVGIGKLLKFTATLDLIRLGRYGDAADRLTKSLWYQQVKTRGPVLVQMLRTGQDVIA